MTTIRFSDGTVFDPASGEVRRDGAVVRLEPQPAALLALLTARPGVLVSHDDIARHVWPPGTHVNFQDGVHYAMRQIRAALGDSARASRFVETMPRRGYRLRAEAVAGGPDAPATAPAGIAPVRWRRRLAAAGLAAAVMAGVALVEQRPNDHHARTVALLTAIHDLIY